MEEAILEHHLRDDPRGALREVVAIEAGLLERGDVRDLHASDPFKRDHPGGGQVPEDARDLHGRVAREVGREPLGVARLLEVVELSPERLHELVGQPSQVVTCRCFRATTRPCREVLDDLEVLVHNLDHVWPASFTTTSVPSWSVAECACPTDAHASGSAWKLATSSAVLV